jgi:hypothetical protein
MHENLDEQTERRQIPCTNYLLILITSGEGSGGAAGARAPLPLSPPWSPPKLEVEEEEENGGWRRKKEESAPLRRGAGFATADYYKVKQVDIQDGRKFPFTYRQALVRLLNTILDFIKLANS